MLPDWVSNRGPMTYKSGALPNALHGPAIIRRTKKIKKKYNKNISIVGYKVAKHLMS